MKILIIQQKMIGDVLLSTMLCEQLKKNISNSEIHYLINTHTEAIVTNNPYIDRVIFFKEEYKNNKWSFYKFLNKINQEKFDVVIDAYGKLESILVSSFSNADTKISMDKWYTRLLYTKTFKYAKKGHSNLGLAIENRLKLLKPFIAEIDAMKCLPKIHLTKNEILKARIFLEKNNIDFSNPVIMINILGSSIEKTYPLPYMAELIDNIACKGEFTILFNYMPSQLDDALKLYKLCASVTQAKIKFEVYTPSLRSFLAILYHCDAIIGNEGGAINIAKALNIPTFSIFSSWIEQDIWKTFNHIKHHEAVHLKDYLPSLLHNKSRKQLKKDNQDLYNKFKPLLFKDKINRFLHLNIPVKKDTAPTKLLRMKKRELFMKNSLLTQAV
ncbi:glycosyltransferase family 9 protein [Formosa sediminum]|uniref:Glycosyltransferase family 9 protein n=1 Tax=Formosa sediminum TaxID=2594004 RepID=A0A516GRS1_9FLAO|nr:glycosyltransferase family 9 protein [Formosa sediminum]QDO94221.1 glycosyltransferase family 9 protein [Formosa sediminum]